VKEKMMKISRRDFIRILAASAGGLGIHSLLTACGTEIEQPKELSVPEAMPEQDRLPTSAVEPLNPPPALEKEAELEDLQVQSSDENIPETSRGQPAEPSSGKAHIAVARGLDVDALVRRSIEAVGGMSAFVPKGAWVIIKPNICVAYHSYEYAATTNPWVVGALVRMATEAGAKKVQVMDHPFGGTPDQAYARSGIREQVEAAGGEMATMVPFKYVKTDIPDGLDIKSWGIYDDVLKADVFIDVPIAKHHSLARLTLGMKNLMGTIDDRGGLHVNLGQRIADLTSRVKPTLTVIDAVRILTANGPTGGSLDDVQERNTVITSPDIVAADSYAATLFDRKPDEIAYIQKGAAMGIGRSDLENLYIEEIAV
jgi:uncharacterized protein (DUF362 family)